MSLSSTTRRFFIVGAAKSGTTSLHHYLSMHPGILMSSEKEARYLAYLDTYPAYRGYGNRGRVLMQENEKRYPGSLEEYESLFVGGRSGKILGETSPAYLYVPSAAANINRLYPGAKIVAILRNPVERAYSAYLHMCREDAEDLSFYDALLAEPERIKETAGIPWRYREMGMYATQLKRYYEIFPTEDIRVYFYEDLRENPRALLGDLCEFLNVEPPEGLNIAERKNVSGIPTNRLLFNLVRAKEGPASRLKGFIPARLRRSLRGKAESMILKRPEMNAKAGLFLHERLNPEIVELENVLQRETRSWLLK